VTANNLGILLAARGRTAEARAPCRRAVAILRRTLGARHPHAAMRGEREVVSASDAARKVCPQP